MKPIVYAELVLQVGSLCFLECKSGQFLFGKSTYYWKFRDSSTYYGPFNTLADCGLNVDAMMRLPPEQQLAQASGTTPQINTEAAEPLMNLIRLDFKNKRRL